MLLKKKQKKNTVILLEPYCGTITEPGLPVVTGVNEKFYLARKERLRFLGMK